jgi:type I restriction enzyme S subunit
MEIRSGYKQTEIGAIPGDWKIAELQQVCRETITYGIVQCGPHVENGVPYIRVSDMDSRELDVNGMLRTSPAIASRFVRSAVEEGDIVYALRGKLGEVRQIMRVVAGANLTQGTARLSPNNQTISSAYLLWAMRSLRALRQAELKAKGTTFREITLADLRQIAIPIPSLGEQRAIAAVLTDVDAMMYALDKLIAKKRDLKQAAMQQLLTGKQRLPGFNAEWVVRTLGELGKFKNGINKSKEDFGHGFPFVNLLDVFGVSSISTHAGLGLVNSSAAERNLYALVAGDVLFVRSSVKPEGVGLTTLVRQDLAATVFSGFLIRFRDGGQLDLGYKEHCFWLVRLRNRLLASALVGVSVR